MTMIKGGGGYALIKKFHINLFTLGLSRLFLCPEGGRKGKKMEVILNYVKPELVVLAVVLYLIGLALKKAQAVKDKFIPLILGIVGIMLALIWVLATSELDGVQQIMLAVFTAIVQGILVAGLSTYANQIVKQASKEE